MTMPPLKAELATRDDPVVASANRIQVAALCRRGSAKKTEVLLITSRDTGRWIVPKGWPIDGLSAPDTALQEAWEEAGVKSGTITKQPVGTYDYDKRLEGKRAIPITVRVYMVDEVKLKDNYPEVDERKRRWVSPKKAAEMVDEPKLRKILRNF